MAHRQGLGCWVVYGMPFLACGIFIAHMAWRSVSASQAMKSWIEVPAQITAAELRVSRTSKKGTVYRAQGSFTYSLGGREYRSSRITPYDAADNVGSFQRDLHRRMVQARDSGQPLPCYVNPAEPAEAVLVRDLRTDMLVFEVMLAVVFGGIGLGAMIAGATALLRRSGETRRREANPGQPWLWRGEWAGGTITSSNKPRAAAAVVAALFWNVTAWPTAWLIVPQAWPASRWVALPLAFVLLVGVVLIGVAVRQVRAWLTYGESVFQMASLPGVIGGSLAGTVRLPVHVQPEEGFLVTLRCANIAGKASGKRRRSSEGVLWEARRTIGRELSRSGSASTSIPVLFGIPNDASPSSDDDPRNRIVWTLEVTAKARGIDDSATFEVPVFRTADSRPDFQLDERSIAPYEQR